MPENPKQRFGDLKPNLALVPASVMIYTALGLEPGAAKYGRFNWREVPVETMTYISATMRHLLEWVDGQDRAHDTGQPHLAHALASLAVLVDAIETGSAVDNRPVQGKASMMIQMVEAERCRAQAIATKALEKHEAIHSAEMLDWVAARAKSDAEIAKRVKANDKNTSVKFTQCACGRYFQGACQCQVEPDDRKRWGYEHQDEAPDGA